jgi:hypothetical protein
LEKKLAAVEHFMRDTDREFKFKFTLIFAFLELILMFLLSVDKLSLRVAPNWK